MVSVQRMMSGMSRFPVRMVCHAILRIDLVPAQVRELEATIRRRCRDSDAQLVGFCADLGTPKRRPEECPALSNFRAGKADAQLIVCVPSDELPPRGDLRTSLALSGLPGAWRATSSLRKLPVRSVTFSWIQRSRSRGARTTGCRHGPLRCRARATKPYLVGAPDPSVRPH